MFSSDPALHNALNVIYEVLHSELVESDNNFVLCKWCIHLRHENALKIKKWKDFKFNAEREGKCVYNDDALKRSGVIEKGARYAFRKL